MERMTKGEGMTPEEYIAMVEEENKKLNKQIEQFKKGVKAGTKIIERLEEENRKLREELSNKNMDIWFDEKAKTIFIDKSGKVIKGGEFTTLC